MHLRRLPAAAAFGVLLAMLPPAGAQQSGAVYTTDRHGRIENVFSSASAVYLAGGPGPNSGCTGNGLADGVYFFQITDPSGATRLSNQPIAERGVLVSGGVIVDATGGHATRSGPCDSRIVQLQPFDSAPGAGSEYKVWLTPADRYAPGQGSHGFLSAFSKTDNFKVRSGGPPQEQSVIQGTVYYDIDEDGLFDPSVPGEVPIPGWKVRIVSGGVPSDTFTDADGHYEFLRNRDFASHDLLSLAPAPGFVGVAGGRWAPTSPPAVTVVTGAAVVTVDFGNLFLVNTPELARSKGYWHNAGRAELAACDPRWRTVVNGLCLRTNLSNPDGQAGTLFTVSETADFDTAFGELSGYLTGDPALGVLAFVLSVQYAAANLNKSCGVLQRITYIDRFGDDVLVSFEEMAADTLALLCNPRSANTGPHGDQQWRAVIMMCLSEWEGMNSSGENIFTAEGAPQSFPSPY